MKGIKTILGALAVASLFTFSFNATAQENGNRDENGNIVRGSYESNKFWDNWFIGVGAGVNGSVGKGAKLNIGGGLAVDANVGKWFTPTLGLRVGYKGLKNSLELKKGYFTQHEDGDFNQHYYHADVMWNMLESLDGYKETRFYNLIPYAQFGVLKVAGNDLEYASGAGLLNTFRLGKHVDLAIDLGVLVARQQILQIARTSNRYCYLPSATAGLVFNLGKTGFDRHSSVTPVVVPLPFTLDQYNALQDRVNALEAENAALKAEIAELKAKAPEVVYRDVMISSPATLYFDSNSAKLSVREKAHLDYYIENVLAKTENNITVYGHADNKTGTAAINDKIAGKRAQVVKDYLVSKGVAESRISVVNEADKNNLFGNPFQLNRCVVIK